MADKAEISEVKELLLKKIRGKGFPVYVIFDEADNSAAIQATSEDDVTFGGAYGDNHQEGSGTTLEDVDLEGLFHLFKDGLRPGDKYYDKSEIEAMFDEDDEDGGDD